MKRRIVSLVIIAMMACSLAACKKDSAQTDKGDNSLQYILDRGKFILGLDDAFPPMGFHDENDEIVGFDIDLAKAVCEKLGVELVLQPIDWDSKVNELDTKNIDCIWNGLSVTPDLQKNLTFSNSYMANEIMLVVPKDSAVESIADMTGKKLAVQSGSSAEKTLDEEANKSFKEDLAAVNPFGDYNIALMDMESGNSDAVLMDSIVANYLITSESKNYKLVGNTFLEDKYAIGFRKDEQALCDAVWNALKELKADGTVNEISTKWFGSDVTTID